MGEIMNGAIGTRIGMDIVEIERKAKLVVCIMGQSCERYIGMCLESVKEADAIVYCDGGSNDGTLKKVNEFLMLDKQKEKNNGKDAIISNEYNQEDKQMNGKQRNFYLSYLKENYKGWYALCLDADEVVEDLSAIKNMINQVQPVTADILFSVKMRHFEGDLGHEDATVSEHFVPHRLFKIRDDLFYPLGEHPVLHSTNEECRSANIKPTTIWHLAYCSNIWDFKKRYENHMKKSEIHTKEFLINWYAMHLFGQYPKKQINLLDIPEIILKEFNIDKDEMYFANRNLEPKHFIMAKQWANFFNLWDNCSVIEFGCGKAPYGFAFDYLGINYHGMDISEFAIKNAFSKNVYQINMLNAKTENPRDLVIAFDLLEHLDYKDLDKAIEVLKEHVTADGDILVSVPVIGDPNLEADKTHKIKEDKLWWINKFLEHGLKLIPTPDDFWYKEQIMIFEHDN